MTDWGLGNYERTAQELEPVAGLLVSMANPLRAERVLDIACGTGNAALLAARFGASVTGVDLAPRLIEVARRRAEAEGLKVTFQVGDAENLQFAAGTFDVVLSVFGMVFATDREKAFAEMLRVLRPGGRAYFTAWLPRGPIHEMVGAFTRAVGAATGRSVVPPAFEWFDRKAVQEVAAGHGAQAAFHDAQIRFVAGSPEDYLARQADHPMSIGMRAALENSGRMEQVTQQALEILRAGNEDPEAFVVTSHYRIVEVKLSADGRQEAEPSANNYRDHPRAPEADRLDSLESQLHEVPNRAGGPARENRTQKRSE